MAEELERFNLSSITTREVNLYLAISVFYLIKIYMYNSSRCNRAGRPTATERLREGGAQRRKEEYISFSNSGVSLSNSGEVLARSYICQDMYVC